MLVWPLHIYCLVSPVFAHDFDALGPMVTAGLSMYLLYVATQDLSVVYSTPRVICVDSVLIPVVARNSHNSNWFIVVACVRIYLVCEAVRSTSFCRV